MRRGLRLTGVMRSVLPSSPRSICRPFTRKLSSIEANAHDYVSSLPRDRERSSGKNGNGIGKLTDRELFVNVLNASTTKRDAKAYISRFGQKNTSTVEKAAGALHVALMILRAPQSIENGVLDGVSRTLSQLSRLGLHLVLVVDAGHIGANGTAKDTGALNVQQCDRIVAALQANGNTKSRRLESILGVDLRQGQESGSDFRNARVSVQFGGILRRTLNQGTIPVIPPIAYSVDEQHRESVDADKILPALVTHLLDLPSSISRVGTVEDDGKSNQQAGFRSCSVDRVIILDPAGGLPSSSRADKAHVFVNLEQEYREIKDDLLQNNQADANSLSLRGQDSNDMNPSSVLGSSNPLSRFNEEQVLPRMASTEGQPAKLSPSPAPNTRHARNLDLAQKCLSLLPPASSALLTTPQEAATTPQTESSASADLGVVTRRPKNPLIFNLLTDKPTISSSLPVARFRPVSTPNPANPSNSPDIPTQATHNRATFFKRGMPVTMIPDPRITPWTPPTSATPTISLSDPRLDFGRLLALIEDSFSRPLDVQSYITRIRHRIAGIIIAGAYEGGAVLTWELPPGVADDGSPQSRARMVPYLDKFAVRKASQGSGGVADVVFSAMVRTCFPQGVCWRSRRENPVNKWYFERSVGSWRLSGSQWSMFWTTEGLLEDEQRWKDYEGVCRSVGTSWADRKEVVD